MGGHNIETGVVHERLPTGGWISPGWQPVILGTPSNVAFPLQAPITLGMLYETVSPDNKSPWL